MVGSVVVFIVNILNLRSGKLEGYAPVAAHADSPTALPIAFQGVKLQSWQCHISRLDCNMEPAQDKTKPLGVFGVDSGSRTIYEKAFQSLMSEFKNRHDGECNM
jgi:hypothetical protein